VHPTDWGQRTCIFRNLGVAKTLSRTSEFIYHQNPAKPEVWDYRFGDYTTDFSDHTNQSLFRKHGFDIQIVNTPIDKKATSYAKTFPRDTAFIFTQPKGTFLLNLPGLVVF
jgi:hypothetical protein